METIRLEISDESARKLRERASERGLSVEAFMQTVAEEILRRSDDQFQRAVDHVLDKNIELYRRLAT